MSAGAARAEPLHAGLIARREASGWRGVLLRGGSGVGKSDLALRAVAAGWRVVADDRVICWRSGARVFGRAPATLHGLCEARGQAMIRVAALAFAPIDLVVDLVASSAELERQPRGLELVLHEVAVRRVALAAREASALARLTEVMTTPPHRL